MYHVVSNRFTYDTAEVRPLVFCPHPQLYCKMVVRVSEPLREVLRLSLCMKIAEAGGYAEGHTGYGSSPSPHARTIPPRQISRFRGTKVWTKRGIPWYFVPSSVGVWKSFAMGHARAYALRCRPCRKKVRSTPALEAYIIGASKIHAV